MAASGSDADLARAGGFHGCSRAERVLGTADVPAPSGDVKRRIQLQILVLSAADVGRQMVKAGLNEGLVPCAEVDLMDPERPTIDAAFLADWAGPAIRRARFQAVVLPNEAPVQLSAAELQALADYEREFGIRQLSSYVFPSAAVGLKAPSDGGYDGPLDGMTAQLTAAAASGSFAYLQGALRFDDVEPSLSETNGYLATPLPADPALGRSFTPLLTMAIPSAPDGPAARGVVLGVYVSDGREQLIVTAAMNVYQLHQQALFPGMLNWLTYGVHLGAERNFLSVHVDDVFLPNERWSSQTDCVASSTCDPHHASPTIMMQPQDVDILQAWQTEHGLKLDLLFNGSGYDRALAKGPFPLGERLRTQRDSFRWLSHTYNHLYLGCAQDFSVEPFRCTGEQNAALTWTSYQDIHDQIVKNQEFASKLGLPVQNNELVTGEHSGLRHTPQEPSDNPSLARALTAAGIAWIGSDGSREAGQRSVGSALTSPRYPMNIYYDAATKAETVDEYNFLYTAAADGGSGACEKNPKATCIAALELDSGFDAYIVPHEARDMLLHTLSNSPRAHFVHQSNLAEERVVYPVLERVLESYRAVFAKSAEVVNASLGELGHELQRQTDWSSAYSGVSAYIEDAELILEAANDTSVSTPITLPADAVVSDQPDITAYSGALSGWCNVANAAQRFRLPDSVGYRTH